MHSERSSDAGCVLVLVPGIQTPNPNPNPFDFFCFSGLPRAPAPLCEHGLLNQRVNVRTTTIQDTYNRKKSSMLGCIVSSTRYVRIVRITLGWEIDQPLSLVRVSCSVGCTLTFWRRWGHGSNLTSSVVSFIENACACVPRNISGTYGISLWFFSRS